MMTQPGWVESEQRYKKIVSLGEFIDYDVFETE
jgi:hypothetical protein